MEDITRSSFLNAVIEDTCELMWTDSILGHALEYNPRGKFEELEASILQPEPDLLIFPKFGHLQSGAGLIFSIVLIKSDDAALHGCLARTSGR